MPNSEGGALGTRILKVQPQPDPRSYKLAAAISSHSSFHVTRVCYYDGIDSLNESYRSDTLSLTNLSSCGRRHGRSAYWKVGQIGFTNPVSAKVIERMIRRLAERDSSDVVHTNGEPDVFGCLAKKGTALPVVHEIYDTYSLYDSALDKQVRFAGTKNPLLLADRRLRHRLNMRWERYVHERADGLVFTSQEMLDKSRELYGDLNAIVIPNGVLRRDMPDVKLAKLGDKDGRIHCVYTGVVRAGLAHRMITPQIRQLTQHKDVVLHIYAAGNDVTYVRSELNDLIAKGKVVLHKPLSYMDLYRELTQYDIGVVLLNPGNTELLEVALPNKLFEYVASGLPVAAPPYKSLSTFISRYSCGITVNDWAQDVVTNLADMKEVEFHEEFTIDHYIPALLKLYRAIA